MRTNVTDIMLHCSIHCLDGVSYLAIGQMASISKASFYHAAGHMHFTTNYCAALEIKLPPDYDEITSIAESFWQKSTGDGAINGCI